MRTRLTQLTLLLCIFMQVWYGSTYRAGMVLCVPTGAFSHESEATSHCDEHCSHHAPSDTPSPRPVPAHDHDCPCCIDSPMPNSTMPPTCMVALASVSQSPDHSDLPAAILPGPEFGVSPSWLDAWPHPPDGSSRRASSGVITTRLII